MGFFKGFHTTQYDLNDIYFRHISTGRLWFPYYIVRFKRDVDICFRHFLTGFPYYIVRFKPTGGAAPSMTMTSCFHTTQYDLNRHQWFVMQEIAWFPYYIVRFKLFFSIFLSISFHFGFHTTQYDLNLSDFEAEKKEKQFPYYIVRFKPTYTFPSGTDANKFPYYIVRFKHIFSPCPHRCPLWFPYYIVRFKQIKSGRKHLRNYLSFHTTQYDLNILSIGVSLVSDSFPYYIVRFKRAYISCSIL